MLARLAAALLSCYGLTSANGLLQSTNDKCHNALLPEMGSITDGRNVQSTNDVTACGDIHGVWYGPFQFWEAGAVARVQIMSYAMHAYVLEGSCSNNTCVRTYSAVEDYFPIDFHPDVRKRYYVVLEAEGTNGPTSQHTGSFSFEIFTLTPPANDRRNGSLPLSIGTTMVGSSLNATMDTVGGTKMWGVWYKKKFSCDGQLKIRITTADADWPVLGICSGGGACSVVNGPLQHPTGVLEHTLSVAAGSKYHFAVALGGQYSSWYTGAFNMVVTYV